MKFFKGKTGKPRAEKKKKTNNKTKTIVLKCIVCFVVILFLCLPAVVMNTVFGYLPALAAIIAIILSFVLLKIQRRLLVFEEMSDLKGCLRETDIDFVVKLKNKSFLVFPKIEATFYISDLFGKDDTLTNAVLTLAPREERKFSFSVRFDHIGNYSAGLKKIVLHDFLGLFTYTINNPKDYKVKVSPKIFDVGNLYISDTALTESEKMIVTTLNEGADYIGVREYVWGDPIKTIHWKLSARTDTYMTKQFESYGIVGVTIVLDTFSPTYDSDTLMFNYDAIVETALSIANYADKSGMEYEIVYIDKNEERQRIYSGVRSDAETIVEELPKISTTSGNRAGPNLLREEGRSRRSHGNIVYCTSNITQEITDILLQLKNRHKNPILFAITPEILEENKDNKDDFLKPLRLLSNAGISWQPLSHASELGGGEVSNVS